MRGATATQPAQGWIDLTSGEIPSVPAYLWEGRMRALGYRLVAGVDEAGRGPLAGPVVAAAVVLPENCSITGLRDSKQLSRADREELSIQIRAHAVAWAFGEAGPDEIDTLNIVGATRLAMSRAVMRLRPEPEMLLVDGLKLPDLPLPARFLVKGDNISASIAAASIIAKVERDAMMERLDDQFPAYGFARHKGYGTREHLTALLSHGPCGCHRRSFAPVSQLLQAAPDSIRTPSLLPFDTETAVSTGQAAANHPRPADPTARK